MNYDTRNSIFLNYRRNGGLTLANSLRINLDRVFGKDTVFQDNFSIRPGENWSVKILDCIKGVNIVLVLIHSDEWFVDTLPPTKYGDTVKLLFRDDDWVRREIRVALEEKKIIIPVVIDDVTLWPKEHERDQAVPNDIIRLLDKQRVTFDENDFEGSISRLTECIRQAVPHLKLVKPGFLETIDHSLNLLEYLPLDPELIAQACYAEAPYVGITYFKREHAPIFFGRERDVKKLYENSIMVLKEKQILLLYGQSGVGKSSLLNASLIPRLEYQGWNVVYMRRQKGKGLALDLDGIQHDYLRKSEINSILIVDQVEEMFTDPGVSDEANIFFNQLCTILDSSPHLRIILSFRKDYLADIKDYLKDRGILFLWYSLRPLDEQGMRRAISGIWKDPSLSRNFPDFSYIEPDLEDAILSNISHDEASNIAPLLQFQLRSLWDLAQEKMKGDIRLSREFYVAEELNDKSLNAFLEKHKLRAVEFLHPEQAENGLINDILFFYTTPRLTAATHTEDELYKRYQHIDPQLLQNIHQELVNEYLLVHDREKNWTRLSHDSLAGIIRQRFADSQASGQRAFSLVSAKEKLLSDGSAIEFSGMDIELIQAGLKGMPTLSTRLKERLELDKKRHQRQKEDRYKLAIETARNNHYHLRYEEVLNNLQTASSEGFRNDQVISFAKEILFPLKELGKEKLLGEFLNFIKKLSTVPDEQLDRYLDSCSSTGEFLTGFDNWMIGWNPLLFQEMKERYFPNLVDIAGGTYEMGSLEGHENEIPIRLVTVDGFLAASTPVTCWQFGLFCLSTGRDLPSDGGYGRGNRPAINVNWFEALYYCNWLSDKMGFKRVYNIEERKVIVVPDANGFRLPTEAEWEYAAREGGKGARYGNGQDIARIEEINFDADPDSPYFRSDRNKRVSWAEKGKWLGKTTPVRSYAPNALGLYDMSGNVWEWCWDWYDESYYQYGSNENPAGPNDGEYRSIRGGSWSEPADGCRCSFRDNDNPIYRIQVVGIRVIRR